MDCEQEESRVKFGNLIRLAPHDILGGGYIKLFYEREKKVFYKCMEKNPSIKWAKFHNVKLYSEEGSLIIESKDELL